MADLETLKQRSFVSYDGYEFLTAEVTARDLHTLIAVAEAARDHVEDFRDPRTGEIVMDGDATLDALVRALSALKDA